MNQDYIKPDNWSIIEEGFDAEKVKSSESLFSLGNGAMGQRANFEEAYSGDTFQGSYIAGVYYPDKTRVGWWKNGYPEYFAKVLNAPNWIGINVMVNGENLDLHRCTSITNFRRELNMKEGWYQRSFNAVLSNSIEVSVKSTRFLSLEMDEVGAIRYEVTPINKDAVIEFTPYLDSGITNEDTNWDDKFWDTYDLAHNKNSGYILSKTMKTDFHVCTAMLNHIFVDGKQQEIHPKTEINGTYVNLKYALQSSKGTTVSIVKYGGYTVSSNHRESDLEYISSAILQKASKLGFDALLEKQKKAWETIWDMSDIVIKGDVKAQQGIRFNIFQLNQTYLGKDARLNIGPKGFTGEKYGGSTYWDTEAYCIPFYMATKNQEVARNLLTYRYHHLDKAIENAKKLGFINGAALYPMVTMNGEECHNEWEITFEEIHRNGAMVFAIYNYVRYTGDYRYIPEKGLEVMIAIARFWHQRATFSTDKNKYVILGVTGPNEYENNINNNWYTNYLAKWCIEYCVKNIDTVKETYKEDYDRIIRKTNISQTEIQAMLEVAKKMYFPYSEKYQVYLQQDGFLDKELITVKDLDTSQRPINQKWSWDRILRSPYIKQADILQGFYMFEDKFTKEELKLHFDFYEPFTVHESSLSPCVHSILAATLDRMDQAYAFYLRTSRLDLDDYNKEVEEGLHITSMAGTWMSIVEGFGGLRMKDNKLSFAPKIPKEWSGYVFNVNYRNQILRVDVSQEGTSFSLEGDQELLIYVNGKELTITPDTLVTV
ncbi:glycoside hydrolase family 65 protein [Aquimarina aquimarini]|uniref:glycoside hydrolase family 65 protein n=1 Tax=Aquimarina aquimarini TaxID=1191734 RepID=UPI000D54E564|nr:glycoside hydrolase family 65 protein [Aquimarina aquimarini]